MLSSPLQSDGLSSSHAALEQDIRSSKEECESLKKELKRVVEMKRKMEWQRDDAGRQLDDLEEKMEVWISPLYLCPGVQLVTPVTN